jgi:hypothetical protein
VIDVEIFHFNQRSRKKKDKYFKKYYTLDILRWLIIDKEITHESQAGVHYYSIKCMLMNVTTIFANQNHH